MSNTNPKYSFTFPYRWLKEDKEFLGENIKRQIIRSAGSNYKDDLMTVLAYKVLIEYHSNKPVNFVFTKAMCQKFLKTVFVNAKCIDVDTEFIQHKSKTMLPIMNFQLFF